MDIKFRVEGIRRDQKKVQLDGVNDFVDEIIEISEEAYRKNYVYRPWPEEEIDQETVSHEATPAEVEDKDAA